MSIALTLMVLVAVQLPEERAPPPSADGVESDDVPAVDVDAGGTPAPAQKPVPVPDAAPAPAPEAVVSTPAIARTDKRGAQRIAVYELELSGVDARTGKVVSDSVLAEVRKLEGVSAVSMEEIAAMMDLEAQKQISGCDDDSCLAEIADALGVDGLLIGSLAVVGEEHVIGLRLIDQREAKVVASYTQRLVPKGGEEFLAAVGPGVQELFPDHRLRAGKARGVAPEVALALNPPPLSPWVFWAATATSAALLVGAGGAAILNGAAVLSWQASVERSKQTPATLDELAGPELAANVMATTGWTLLALGAVAGAGAGVAALFTDWEGYGDAQQ